MKRLIVFIIFAILLFPLNLCATDITLEWDRNTEDITGYIVYRGFVTAPEAASGPMCEIARVSQTPEGQKPEYVDTIPDGSNIMYVVTAYDSEGRESGPSNFAMHPIPYQECPECPDCSQLPGGVVNLKISGVSEVDISIE